MIYFTSDIHFGHKTANKCFQRPFSSYQEMEDTLIENWNNTISVTDTVYCLGDISFLPYNKNLTLLTRLNGNKILIRGNHDLDKNIFDKDGTQLIYKEIHDYLELRIDGYVFILFHYPILSWNKQDYGSYHLYGHIHNYYDLSNLKNSMDVGVDANNYTPISIEKVLDILHYKKA